MSAMISEDIPLSEIDNDSQFNCRGHIAPIDVADLVRSIDLQGLQQPVVVHRYNFLEQQKTGKKYRLVSGYRRFTSITALNWEKIPCIVKEWMSESKARVLNLEENLKRKDLNVLQEAKAIEKLKIAGYTQEQVANELGVSRSWVQIRYNVLDFPEDIQREVGNGVISQPQIKEIYSLPRQKQYEAVRELKNRKIRGEKNIKITKPVAGNSRKTRDKTSIKKMLDHLYDNLGPGLATRCLAWASGSISSHELFVEIRSRMNEEGKEYEMPEDDF